ncbi:Folylpolyglutamate Synthase [Manis pentadactyla]|nr:Folylpolyglutamate Synthase [Manis pentadactyla]
MGLIGKRSMEYGMPISKKRFLEKRHFWQSFEGKRSAKSSTQLTSSPHFRWRQGPRLDCSSRKHRRLAAQEGATDAAPELRRRDVATICCSGLEEVAEGGVRPAAGSDANQKRLF